MSNALCINEPTVTETRRVAVSEPKAKHYSLWNRVVMHFTVQKHLRKITKALNEAEQIHAGRKSGKSFDQFLKEI